jgi:hypothetical protein
MGKLRRGSRWEVLEPREEGIVIHIGISSIGGWNWTGKGRGSRTWVIGSTGAREVWGAWACCSRTTNDVHVLRRFASLQRIMRIKNYFVIKTSSQITWWSGTPNAMAKLCQATTKTRTLFSWQNHTFQPYKQSLKFSTMPVTGTRKFLMPFSITVSG